MDRAFDKRINDKVFAKDLTIRDKDMYRYKCLACDEYLTLSAVDSKKQSPHFRHRNGNNDKDCDYYLNNLISFVNRKYYLSDSENNKKTDIFFNNKKNIFEFGLFFYYEDIEELYNNDSIITIKQGSGKLFNKVPITKIPLISNSFTYFKLEDPFKNLKIFIDDKLTYVVKSIQNNNLLFFKLKSNNHFKLLSNTDNLYIDTEYIVMSKIFNKIRKLSNLVSNESNLKINQIQTSDDTFFWTNLTFGTKNSNIDIFLNSNGYNLQKSESINIIWPPLYQSNEELVSMFDSLFLNSSFELEKDRNTNASFEIIKSFNKEIYKFEITDPLLIGKDNIDLKIFKDKFDDLKDETKIVETLQARSCKVLESSSIFKDEYDKYGNLLLRNYDYYLLNYSGIRKIYPGETIKLRKNEKILGYEKRFKRIEIQPILKKELSLEEKILDMLRFYPKLESYTNNEFQDYSSNEFLKEYLKVCQKKGKINSLIKLYLQKGLLWIT